MPKYTPMGEAMGTDMDVIAKVVAACVREERPLNVSELTTELSLATPGKAAITMKYAVKAGYMRRATRDPQDAYEPTELGLETFPPDRPHVMPDAPVVKIGKHTVQGVSGKDAAAWEPERPDEALPPPPSRKELEG